MLTAVHSFPRSGLTICTVYTSEHTAAVQFGLVWRVWTRPAARWRCGGWVSVLVVASEVARVSATPRLQDN